MGLLILSLFGNAYFFTQLQTERSTAADATALSQTLTSYFDNIGYQCSVRPSNIDGVSKCVTGLVKDQTGLDTIEEEDFDDVNQRDDEAGYLVVKNTGSQSFNSSAFTLLKNKEIADTKCQIDGTIDSGYTCRLDFGSPCDPGDVLEVQYDNESAYLKTC
jgi:hypothetical protein